MGNNEINNPSSGFDGLFGNMPPPAEAWRDMRRRLDDEMPAGAGLPLPGGIINVNNRMLYSITWLFSVLLLLTFLQAGIGPLNSFNKNSSNNNVVIAKGRAAKPNIAQVPRADNTPLGTTQMQDTIAAQPKTGSQNAPVIPAGNTNTTKHATAKSKKHLTVNSGGTQKHIAGKPGTASQPQTNQDITQGTSATPSSTGNNAPGGKQEETTAAKNSNTPIKPAAKANTETTTNEAGPAEQQADSTREWQAGVWFKAQLPFSSAQHYFAGPNGASQPWRVALPGVWISYQYNKHVFEAEVNPFASLVFNPKPFNTTTYVANGQIVTKTETLNKTFGTSLSVGYSYNIKNNWWAGGRVQTTIVTGGVATNTFDPANLRNDKTFAPLSADDKAMLAKMQVKLDAELMYKMAGWAAGLRAGFYFSPSPVKGQGINNPLETELFVRWRLWQHRK